MVHYLARIIILSVVMFTCVNHNTTLAQEFQDWCVHVDGLESHGLFRKKQDIGRTSLFYRTKIFPNVILRISDNGVTNQFTIYRTNYLNDTTLELKSIGYEELNVEIEKKPLDVTKKRFTVFLNNCEIPGTNYESDSSFFFDFVYYAGGCEIDIDLVRYEIKQNQKETRLNIPALGNYHIKIPDDYKNFNIIVSITSPTNTTYRLNRIIYHSKLLFSVKQKDELNENPQEVFRRNVSGDIDFIFINELFLKRFKEYRKIVKQINFLIYIDEHDVKSIIHTFSMMSKKKKKELEFKRTRNPKFKNTATNHFYKMKKSINTHKTTP